MALAITSFTPSAASTLGGTEITITGTGLDTVDVILVGTKQAQIVGTSTATNLTFRCPSQPAGTYSIFAEDETNTLTAKSATTITYSVPSNPVKSTSLAAKWKVEVDTSVAQDGSSWTAVGGLTNFQPAIAQTTQDDSDYDDVDDVTGISWGSDVVTQLKWSLVMKLSRKTTTGYTEDPGQAQIRSCYDKSGDDANLHVRWYDRNGGDEAYEGTGLVEWSEDGGDLTQLSSVSVTVMGRGKRLTIDNPAA